MRGEYSK